jgi:hypothetical protein
LTRAERLRRFSVPWLRNTYSGFHWIVRGTALRLTRLAA